MHKITLPEFADRLNELMPQIMRGFFRKQPCPLAGTITPVQYLLLNYLHSKGESTMTALSRYLDVTTAAVTGIVERLVRDRFVERLFDPGDRRVIRVRLSAKGSSMLARFAERKKQTIISIFSKISERDRAEYLRIITQVYNVMGEKQNV